LRPYEPKKAKFSPPRPARAQRERICILTTYPLLVVEQIKGEDYWKIVLIVIPVLSSFPLPGDRDCDQGFVEKEYL